MKRRKPILCKGCETNIKDIDISNDQPMTHLLDICSKCYGSMRRISKVNQPTQITPEPWTNSQYAYT